MNARDDGGPAFPVAEEYTDDGDISICASSGMTLRDYFAAKAMQGMLAYSHVNPSHGNWVENCDYAGVARDAYAYADAMIDERSKK